MFTAKTLVDDKVAGFEAGADDYLTKPTHPAELASRVKAVLARTASKQATPANEQGALLAVIGTRGGLGTTTIATNIASILGKKEQTILADLRLGQGTLGAALGFPHVTGMTNLLTRPIADIKPRTVSSEIMTHNTGLRLLLSSTRPKEAQITASPEAAKVIIQTLRGLARLVVVDLGTGLTPVNLRILQEATQLLVVVDSQRVTLNMARELLSDLNEVNMGQGRTNLVMVNRTQSSLQIPWQEAEQVLGREMMAIISPAPELAFQANEAGVPIIHLQPGAIVATQLNKLAQEVGMRLQVGVRP